MSDETVDYESKYKESVALSESLTNTLNEKLDEINKLKADLAVAQLVNKKTVGASNVPPNTEVKTRVNIREKWEDYKKSFLTKKE